MAKILKPVSKISGSYGQNAEEEISQRLADELPDNFLILNSPRVVYQNDIWDIDHVIIGPTGLYIIESKNMNGKITGGLMGNWVQERRVNGKRERIKIGNPANQVNQYTKIIRQLLRKDYQEQFEANKNIKAQSIVVFAHEQSDISKLHYTQPGKVGKVNILSKDQLISFILENEQIIYTEEEIQRFADILVPPDQRDQTGIYTSLIMTPMIESFKSRYELMEEIGRGNFGAVYSAFDTKMEREVAVKKLHTVKKDKEVVNRFLREAKITAKLKHENIVTFYDYLEEDGECYIVMELVEGSTLEELTVSDNLSLDEVVEIFIGITSALQHAHSNNVIHRDLKPANIIITEDNKVKVTDFGIARLSDELNITQSNASVGTPNIMSPEQIMGKEIDHRSDIFALGVLLFYLSTGEFPFQGQSLGEVVNKIIHEEPIKPSSINPAISEQLELIILQALSKDPEDRFQSAEEMGNTISELVGVYDFSVGKKKKLNLLRNLKHIFKLSYWSDFLKNDKKKFHAISIATMIVIASLFAFQSYQDSIRITNDNSILPFTGNSAIAPNRNGEPAHFTDENIHLFFRNPNQYVGATANINARMVEFVGSMDNRVALMKAIIKLNGEERSILVAYTGGDPHIAADVLGKDVRLSGTIDQIAVTNSLGETNTKEPIIFSHNIEVVEFLGELVARAELVVEVNQTINHNGKQLTLERIEFARRETRVHVKLTNNTSEDSHFSFKEPRLIQGTKVFSPLPGHNQALEFDLASGQEASGIIYFSPTNMYNTYRTITFSIDSNIFGDKPYVFNVRY